MELPHEKAPGDQLETFETFETLECHPHSSFSLVIPQSIW